MDRTPRYAPSRVMTHDHGMQPVTGYVAHPPGSHPSSPIRDDFTALELVTPVGSRWWGVERAYINSELRMVVVGFPSRCELRSKWEVAKHA